MCLIILSIFNRLIKPVHTHGCLEKNTFTPYLFLTNNLLSPILFIHLYQMFKYTQMQHIYSFLKVKILDLKIILGNFLRKTQMYGNGHYFLLTVILQAPTTLSSLTGPSFSAGQLALSLTGRPATF